MNDEFENIEIIDFKQSKKINKKEQKKKNEEQKQKAHEEKMMQKEKDQEYAKLFQRIKNQIQKDHPEIGSNQDMKLQLCLNTLKIGAGYLLITNFYEICEQLNRHPQHVKNFVLDQLGGQTGSLKEKGFLIKQNLSDNQAKGLIKKYYLEYVRCQECLSKKTKFKKDQKSRQWYKCCSSCQATSKVKKNKGIQKNKTLFVEKQF